MNQQTHKSILVLSVTLNVLLAGLFGFFVWRGQIENQPIRFEPKTASQLIDLKGSYPADSSWKRVESSVLNLSVMIPEDWTTQEDTKNNDFSITNPKFYEEIIPASETLTTNSPQSVIMRLQRQEKVNGQTFAEIAVSSSDSVVTNMKDIRVGGDAGRFIDSYEIPNDGPYVYYAKEVWVEHGEYVIYVHTYFRDHKMFQDLYEDDVLAIIGSINL